MSGKFIKIVFSLLFLLTETILLATSYDDWRDYNRKNDHRFDYQTAYNYSDSNPFWIDSRSEFLNNRDYRPLVNLARQDGNLNNFLNTRVAPNIHLTDYVGYKIKENTTWQNYSNLSRSYETQNYSNVIKEGENYQSLEITSLRNGWKVKEKVGGISYGDVDKDGGTPRLGAIGEPVNRYLPTQLILTTNDLAGNTFIQNISELSYGRSSEQSRLKSLINLSLEKSHQEGMYGYDNLHLNLKDRVEPPHYVVKAFNLEATDPQGKVSKISFSDITWSKNKIIGFKAEMNYPLTLPSPTEGRGNYEGVPSPLMGEGKGEGDIFLQVTTTNDKIVVNVTANDETFTYILDQDITTKELIEKLKLGINPLEILGSNKIQLGDAKLVFLTKTYTDEGILEDGPKQFTIDYGITGKKTAENKIKTNLAKLEVIAPEIVRKTIADTPIKDLDKESLTQLQEMVVSAIQRELYQYQTTVSDSQLIKNVGQGFSPAKSNPKGLPYIKNDWQLTLVPTDKLKLKLVDNQIVSETELVAVKKGDVVAQFIGLTTEPINRQTTEITEGIITNVSFAIENGELKAISGIYTKTTGEIQKLSSPKAEAINNLPQAIMVKEKTVFSWLKEKAIGPGIVGAKDLISSIADDWSKNTNKTEAVSKGITEGFFVEKGKIESDSKFVIYRRVENFSRNFGYSTAAMQEYLNEEYEQASGRVGISKFREKGEIIILKSSVFASSLIVETGLDVAKLGSDVPAMARSFKSAFSSFKDGDTKAGWRYIGVGTGLVLREGSRAMIIGGILRSAETGVVRAGVKGIKNVEGIPQEVSIIRNETKNISKVVLKQTGGLADVNKLKTTLSYLEKTGDLPVGKVYEGRITRYTEKRYITTLWDHLTTKAGRYNKQGMEVLYTSKNIATNLAEFKARLPISELEKIKFDYKNIKIEKMLDLTEPDTLRKLGIEIKDLVGNSYQITQEIGEFAIKNGYNGIIAPSARINEVGKFTSDYANVILFKKGLESIK